MQWIIYSLTAKESGMEEGIVAVFKDRLIPLFGVIPVVLYKGEIISGLTGKYDISHY